MDNHPDLPEISARMRACEDQFQEALEQSTAHLRRMRRSTRELLLECEAVMRPVTIWCRGGVTVNGVVAAVGSDHIIVSGPEAAHVVATGQIVAFQLLNER